MKSILKTLYQNSRNKRIRELIFKALNKNENIRYFAAHNISTPVSILDRLSGDQDYSVRSYVAENPKTPIHILEKLSKDKNINVREALIYNQNWIKSK